jgi:hypothetical protein
LDVAQAEDMCIIGSFFASLTLLRGTQTLPFLGTISTMQPPHNKGQGYGTLLVLFIVLGWELRVLGRLFEIGFHVGQVDNSLSSFRWETTVHVG